MEGILPRTNNGLRQKSSVIEKIKPYSTLCFYFIVFTDSIYLLFSGFDNGGQLSEKSGGSLAYQGLIFISYFVVLYKLVSVWPVALRTLIQSRGLIILVVCSIASYAAAGVENVVLLRYVLYLLTICAALDISSRYSIDEVCETFFYTAFFIVIVYFLAYPVLRNHILYDELARPNMFGFTSYAGLFPHKNAAAEVFALSFIISLARFYGTRDAAKKYTSLIMMCGSILAIAMAGAVGPLLALMLGLLASYLFLTLIRGDILRVIIIGCIICLAVIAAVSIGLDEILHVFGRTADLTGRRILAEYWQRFFSEKPMLGYGFGGFFTGLTGAPGEMFSHLLSKDRMYATFENAYLDILIQFGLIGGIIYAIIIIKAIIKSALFYKTSTSTYKVVPINILAYVLISSFSDASLLLQNYIVCIFVFWIYFGVDRVRVLRQGNSSNATLARAQQTPATPTSPYTGFHY